ncbi:MAG: hypothetical protein NTY70_12145, partial [Burkholderiales bacterium]|nr:hypothetical protein [Burkholderiales bacterium]
MKKKSPKNLFGLKEYVELRCVASRLLAFITIFWATHACASLPPNCDDHRVIDDIHSVYGQMMKTNLPFKNPNEIRSHETFFGAYLHGKLIKNRKPEQILYSTSRYCIALIQFDSGKTDTLYYRIDGQKDEAEEQFAFTPCSEEHV